MPKTAAKPTRASTKARNAEVEDEEDDEEEEEVPARRAKTATASKSNGKASTKAAVSAKPAVKSTKKSDDDEGTYAPNPNSMRDFAMRAMRRGGTSVEIKKRAARLAERANVEALSDPKAYKNFDVSFFAKLLKGKGFDVDIDEEGDTYKLN